jgi:hypothetical protein
MAHIKNTGRTVALAFAILGLAGCAEQVAAEEAVEVAVKVEAVAGTDLSKVTLTDKAITRLGLKTEPVRIAPSGGGEIVSFSAILYDAAGGAWVYTSPAPRSFVRASIVVDRVEGDVAYLSSGPKVGTTVVTQAVQELYGAEYGVGGE